MRKRDRQTLPAWADRNRSADLGWIIEDPHVPWPVAKQGYEELGCGAIVVDTTPRPTESGRRLGYFPQSLMKYTGDEDTQRMAREYDPSWVMVTVLLKTSDRTSTYRVATV